MEGFRLFGFMIIIILILAVFGGISVLQFLCDHVEVIIK